VWIVVCACASFVCVLTNACAHKTAHKLKPDQIEELRAVFKIFDDDGNAPVGVYTSNKYIFMRVITIPVSSNSLLST